MSISPSDLPKVNVKLLLLGQANVGKSSLMLRYTDGSFYDNKVTTIGIENKNVIMKMPDKQVNLQIWDTAGQQKWKYVPTNYFRNVNGIIVVYDISYHQSFMKVSDWMQKIIENTKIQKLCLILVGNKSDLEREVKEEEGKQFAHENNMMFLETSAKTAANVDLLFTRITHDILKKDIFEGSQGSCLKSNGKAEKEPNNDSKCC